jgi:hypothetical protein
MLLRAIAGSFTTDVRYGSILLIWSGSGGVGSVRCYQKLTFSFPPRHLAVAGLDLRALFGFSRQFVPHAGFFQDASQLTVIALTCAGLYGRKASHC